MQHTIDRTPKLISRKPAAVAGILALGVIGGIGVGAFVIWLLFIPKEVPADFVYNLNSDQSLDWTLHIPPSTWERIAGDKTGPTAATQIQVMKLVAQGFDNWEMSAHRCYVTDVTMGPDGSARYQGKCAWGGTSNGQGT